MRPASSKGGGCGARHNAGPARSAVKTAPIADFGLSPAHPAATDEIRLYDFSYDPGGVGISIRSWDFGDGDTSTKVSPRHRFETKGTHDIRLMITTFDGRQMSTVRTIRIG